MTETLTTECRAPKPGLSGYKHHGCNCPVCKQANRDHSRNRTRMLAYGRWQPLVDADPARRHVRWLMANGMGWQRVAAVAGVSEGAVSRMLYGRNSRPPTRRIRRETETALLAVTLAGRAPHALVDATGARRRVQALAVIGWSLTEQARRLGYSEVQGLAMVLRQQWVTVRTAQAVAGLYDQMWARPAPAELNAARTRRWAARKGFASPLAWDDDAIDDPRATPEGGPAGDEDPAEMVDEVAVQRAARGDRTVRLTRPERLATVRLLHQQGAPRRQIEQALSMSGAELRRTMRQIGLEPAGVKVNA